jgi:hypothetical protein
MNNKLTATLLMLPVRRATPAGTVPIDVAVGSNR